MKDLNNYSNILWDFDGVLMDSMPVRNKGFELVLEDFPEEQVQKLLTFHLKNGGLSRYVKFRHFFEEIRNEKVSEDEINIWASKFSDVMKSKLLDKKLLINDSLSFVKDNYHLYNMHIVSGSDQTELRFLCKKLDIDIFFKSIHGSPTPKKELVANLLMHYGYCTDTTVLIGDSINDFEAAEANKIDFMGYNCLALKDLGRQYINSFGEL